MADFSDADIAAAEARVRKLAADQAAAQAASQPAPAAPPGA